MEISPDDVVEQLRAPQGGAEVEVQVLDPKQKLVPTPGGPNLLMAAVQEDFVANSMWTVSLPASLSCCGPQH